MSTALHLCLLVVLLNGACVADQISERRDNSVEVKLYPLSESEWSSGKVSDFQASVAQFATSFCGANPQKCGGNSPSFTSDNIMIVSTEDNSKSMFAEFYVDIPSAVNTPFVLSADTIEVISEQARDQVHSLTGTWITYIGETYLGVPVQSTANAVIIPVAVIVVVCVALVTIGLALWKEKQEKQSRKLRREASRRQKHQSGHHHGNAMVKRAGQHGNGNKVMPNGDAARTDHSDVTTTRSVPKFQEKVEMVTVSRNHFTEQTQTNRTERDVNGISSRATEVPPAHQYQATPLTSDPSTRVVSHTAVVNGQLVDHYTSSSTPTTDRDVTQEESERQRRKREKRERRAEREIRKRMREERDGYGRID